MTFNPTMQTLRQQSGKRRSNVLYFSLSPVKLVFSVYTDSINDFVAICKTFNFLYRSREACVNRNSALTAKYETFALPNATKPVEH